MKAHRNAALGALAATALSACAYDPGLRQDIIRSEAGTDAAAAPAQPIHTLMHPLFQDHAVIQRDRPIRVWGWTAPFADVELTLASASGSAMADSAGRWEATLPAMPAGGPYRLTARSSTGTIQAAEDVLVGDVWLCSGQSNMEWPVRLSANAQREIETSANPRLRLFTVPRASSPSPQDSFTEATRWGVSGPGITDHFSAACYFMGRELERALNLPVGLIASSWGGTRIQAWISELGLRGVGNYGEALAMLDFHAASPEAAELSWANTVQRWWRANDPGSRAAIPWSAPEFDDAGWQTMVPNGAWENSGRAQLANFDGIAWFRTTVDLTLAQARQAATLSLGPIDDMDSVWINGARIGGGEGYDAPRTYPVELGYLRPGRNLIAVGVLDTGGAGGMTGPLADKALAFADGSRAPLSGPWRWRISAPLAETGAAPRAPWLSASGLATLNNGMIAPVAPYAIRGAAWYQGESNAGEPEEYKRLLPALMADWRRQFSVGALPFLIVQLANYGPVATAPGPSGWAGVREAQRLTAGADANAGLVVTVDIGDRFDIHPTNKQQVGLRLANVAREVAYRHNLAAHGPAPAAARRLRRSVQVSFANAGDGLVTWGAARPLGFELCDAARNCRYVDATLVAGARVSLSTAGVRRPAFVRYCWADSPVCTLANAQGLPATPFELAIP